MFRFSIGEGCKNQIFQTGIQSWRGADSCFSATEIPGPMLSYVKMIQMSFRPRFDSWDRTQLSASGEKESG